MKTQKVFQAGNSHVVAIPKHLSRKMELTPGQKVVVAPIPQSQGLVIKKAAPSEEKTSKSKTKLEKEFKVWLDSVLQEDAEILDELAIR